MAIELLVAQTIVDLMSADTRSWLRELKVHDEIDSTNTHLMRRSSSETIDGVVCFAESQTAGRGRRGRTWLTPRGQSIAVSFGKNLAIPVSEIGPLSLVVGVGVARALDSLGIAGVGLKWPNDILLEGAKAGGVLIELAGIAQPLVVVIGIGLNVGGGNEVRERLGIPVADLSDKVAHLSRNTLAAAVLEHVHAAIVEFEQMGFAPLRERWEGLHAHQHRRVVLSGANETIEGIARGVSMTGELILETAAGISRFSGGEVSLRADQRVC